MRLARQIGVLLVFLGLAVVFTFPLVLHPATYLRPHTDARLFTWVAGWVARGALENPRGLFDAPIFYPHGNTLAFSEPLLVPALVVFAPVYAASGNPVLAHNVTVLLMAALSGWAAYYAASRLTGSVLGGWVAGIAFALSPFRTGYYGILTMQTTFAIPLALLAFARFLERQRLWYLVGALLLVWCQAVSVWYFGVPLALLLALVGLEVLLLRPRGWRPGTFVALAVGGILLGLALLPIARPYLETRAELGFERTLDDAAQRPADLLSYVDAGPEHRFYRLADSRRYPALFPGFTVLALSAAAFLWLRGAAAEAPPGLRRVRRVVAGALAAVTLLVIAFLVAGGRLVAPLGITTLTVTDLEEATTVLLLLGGAALGFAGWTWAARGGERPLRPPEWVALVALGALVFVLLSLGPTMLLGGEDVGAGLFRLAYALVPGFKVIRIPLRLAVVVLLLLGLLAAFGVAWLETRLGGGARRWALGALPVLLLIEYVSFPLAYEAIPWHDPPPVYRWLAAQPGEAAAFEWPSGDEDRDAYYLLWSLLHEKRLVNGVSGFFPDFTRFTLRAVRHLPDPDAVAYLRGIYPLRYLIVHLHLLPPPERAAWEMLAVRPPAGLGPARRFDGTLVLEVRDEAERRWRWERTFAGDLVARRPRARFLLGLDRDDPEVVPRVEVSFNGRALAVLTPTPAVHEVEVRVPPPYHAAEPNRLTLQHGYRLGGVSADDPRYRLGRTGVASPVDLVVESAGRPHGRFASIVVNGVDVAPNLRGYNVAVVDPRSGTVTARDVFDTFVTAAEARRLAEFVEAVPAGWIVAAAIKDEGVGQLTDEAVRALESVGGAVDPRGTLHVSHVLIGVKGAPRGSAVEAVAPRRLTRVVGVDRRDRAMIVGSFRLEP